jgi:hypothetical protein
MPTRKQYLDGECTLKDYYLDIADAAGLRATDKALLARCVAALKDGDEHLNSVPLPIWDSASCPASVAKAMRERGDYATKAGLTCLRKAVYIRAAGF